MRRKAPLKRKTYPMLGIGISCLGFLLFSSLFFPGDLKNIGQRFLLRGMGGIALLAFGIFLATGSNGSRGGRGSNHSKEDDSIDFHFMGQASDNDTSDSF